MLSSPRIACLRLGSTLAVICAACAPAPGAQVPTEPARALICTWTYEGVATRVRVEPTQDPYRVRPIDIDKCFALKLVYVREPLDVSAVNIYVYDVRGESPLPIHQSKYLPPYAGTNEHGFTGLQSVYESNGDELQYFCEWQGS